MKASYKTTKGGGNKKYQQTEQKLFYATYQMVRIRKNTICLRTDELCRLAGVTTKTFCQHYHDPDALIEYGVSEAKKNLRAITSHALRFHFTLMEFWTDVLSYIADKKRNHYIFSIATERGDRGQWEECLRILLPFLRRFFPDDIMQDSETKAIFCALYCDSVLWMIRRWGERGFVDSAVGAYSHALTTMTLNAGRIFGNAASQVVKILS